MGLGLVDKPHLRRFKRKLDAFLDNTFVKKVDYHGYFEITGTLAAGSTTITLSDERITGTATVDTYTNKFGVNPTDIVVDTGSVTLTFSEQNESINVKVRIS